MAEKLGTGESIGFSPEIGWSQWADGDGYRLRRGEDFTQPPTQARRAFLSWASRWDLGTHSSADDDAGTLAVQVVPRRGSLTVEQLAQRLDRRPRWVRARVDRHEIATWTLDGVEWVTPREVARVVAEFGTETPSIPEQRTDEPCGAGQ